MLLNSPALRLSPLLLAAVVGLSACESFTTQTYDRPAPVAAPDQPANGLVAPPAGATSGTAGGAPAAPSGVTGTYPYGTAGQTGDEPARKESGEVVRGPDGSVWSGDAAQNDQKQADVESCYSYAVAQTVNDARIEQDRRAVYGAGLSDTQSAGLLRSRMKSFDHEQRRKSLFESCMRSKGYSSR